MSFRAVVETVLHLQSFKNLELYEQGLYFLRFRLYYEVGGSRYYAHPYDVRTVHVGRQIADSNDYSPLEPARAVERENAFYSRQFLIVYIDEEVPMNDFCTFRSEIEIAPRYLDTQFFLDVQLYWAEANALGKESLS